MPIIFSFPESADLASSLAKQLGYKQGALTLHRFPDTEAYVRIDTDVQNQTVILVTSLDHADMKILPLLFFVRTAQELGAKRVGLVCPYLAYMRQDACFKQGEAISAKLFAQLLSSYIDWLITVDPHLHRFASLDQLFSIPGSVMSAAVSIAEWIDKNVSKPLIIGPDKESKQWVQKVATHINAPYVVMKKIRHGDRKVEIEAQDFSSYRDRIPVLVDDIISTAGTMIEAVKMVKQSFAQEPFCVGVHAVFAGVAYEALQQAGVSKIVTCNTIQHVSNGIDVSKVLSEEIKQKYSV